jgi:hypothetical protein
VDQGSSTGSLPHKITINVPVVFMAWYIMVLRGATSLLGALEGVGPENQDFFGPTPSNAPNNYVAHLKTILSISAIKNNRYIGNFMYTSVVVLFCVRGMGRSPCSCVVCLVRRY